MPANDDLPWKERATAVGRSGASEATEAMLLFEGTLLEVARSLACWSERDLRRVRLSMPDRQVAPRSFEREALVEVIARSKAVALRQRLGMAPLFTARRG